MTLVGPVGARFEAGKKERGRERAIQKRLNLINSTFQHQSALHRCFSPAPSLAFGLTRGSLSLSWDFGRSSNSSLLPVNIFWRDLLLNQNCTLLETSTPR